MYKETSLIEPTETFQSLLPELFKTAVTIAKIMPHANYQNLICWVILIEIVIGGDWLQVADLFRSAPFLFILGAWLKGHPVPGKALLRADNCSLRPTQSHLKSLLASYLLIFHWLQSHGRTQLSMKQGLILHSPLQSACFMNNNPKYQRVNLWSREKWGRRQKPNENIIRLNN